MNDLALFADFDTQIAHDQGAGHPERPDRLRRIRDVVGAMHGLSPRSSAPATRAQLVEAHDEDYVDRLLEMAGQSAVLDPDTRVGPPTIDAALSAAGCGLAAVNAVLTGRVRRAFSLVRPPGHHAEAGRAMGFCYFNNIAVMAMAARRAGIERILVVDWDVHHGNGTQHRFEASSEVAVFNVHQFPFYPGSGKLSEVGSGPGRGYTVNCPMSAGHGDEAYFAMFDHVLAPLCERFEPQLILVSAGYDAHESDLLGAMNVTDEGFRDLASRVRSLADEYCDGRLVATLEGGYDLDGLAGGVRGTIAAWRGEPLGFKATEGPFEGEVAANIEFHR